MLRSYRHQHTAQRASTSQHVPAANPPRLHYRLSFYPAGSDLMPRRATNYAYQAGFGLIDLLLAFVVLSVLAAFAVPNIKSWSRNYQLRRACWQLYSHMQMARSGAIKENQPWSVNFTANGYEVRDGNGTVVQSVNFATDFQRDIQYKHPQTSTKFDVPTITFNPNGLTTNVGYAYLSDSNGTSYYRVGVPLITGTVRIEKWNGSTWQ